MDSSSKKIYVTMTDRFMSGWGMAKDTISKFIIVCDDLKQARQVADYVKCRRNEMKYVNIVYNRPKYPAYYRVDFLPYEQFTCCHDWQV